MKKSVLYFLCLICLSTQAFSEVERQLQFENEKVKVWKTIIPPAQNLKLHRHDQDRVVVGLKGGSLMKIEETGEKLNLAIATGKAYWFPKDPPGELHGDLNPSDHNIEVMVIEFKDS